MPAVNVLIVEDDPLLRASMHQGLNSLKVNICGAVTGSREAMAIAQSQKVDVALLDIDLGVGANGVDIARKLREIDPQIGIIFLTTFFDPRIVSDDATALPKGARYIQKSSVSDLRQLVEIIVSTRENPLRKDGFSDSGRVELSDQHILVLKLVASGLTTFEIAKRLKISERAVEKSLTKIQILLGIQGQDGHNPRVMLTRAYSKLSGKSFDQ